MLAFQFLLCIKDLFNINAEETTVKSWRIILRFLKDNPRDLKYVFGCIIASLIHGVIPPVLFVFMGGALDIMTGENDENFKSETIMLVINLVVVAICAGIVSYVQTYMFVLIERNCKKNLMMRSFQSILNQDMSWIDKQSNSIGEIYTNVIYDISNVTDAIKSCLINVSEMFAILIACLVFCFIFNWKLALILLTTAPLLCAAVKIENILELRSTKKEVTSYKETNKIAIEAISNMRTVASLHKEKSIMKSFEVEVKQLRRAGIEISNLQGFICGFTECMICLSMAAVVYFGPVLFLQGAINFANYFSLLRMVHNSLKRVVSFIPMTSNIEKGLASAKRLYAIYDRKPAIGPNDVFGNHPPQDAYEALRLQNVHFSYPSREDVKILNGIDLRVFKGQRIALVGSSGCGKSTIFQLFLRMYDPQTGTVSFAGKNVRSLITSALRANIAMVSQEPIVFDRSIKENIAYGDNLRLVPIDEIIVAARTAKIHDFITSLPEGYETRVGDKGTFFSGGQKQRIAIARALVRNPKVLFLDEATSALDSENAKIVQHALDEAQLGRTSVIITHNFATIANCDAILVIQNGKIVEIGSHNDLLKRNGYYKKLHDIQMFSSALM